ncbi:hypothetical protein [Carnobacterium maltaromaticum]|uniref:hypothetical protein n=1 Tax=Carnobacterium maltaromaticum TaxID=2751 RepID=UPI0039BDB547
MFPVFPIMSSAYFPYLLVIFKADQIPYPFSQFAIEQENTVNWDTLYKIINRKSLNQKKDFYQLSEKTTCRSKINQLVRL